MTKHTFEVEHQMYQLWFANIRAQRQPSQHCTFCYVQILFDLSFIVGKI